MTAETVTRARHFLRYPETTVGADFQIADTTQLLLAWAGGDAAALDALAPRIYRELHRPGAVWDMGMLAITAGACAIVAGLWCSGRDNSWLLALHGVALGAFGLIGVSLLVRGPLSFRPVSLLFIVMAVNIGAFALATAQRLRSDDSERLFLRVVGAASIGFAFSFLAVGFHWISLGPPYFFVWMSSYFGFCAMFMLWLAFRVHSRSLSQSGHAKPLSPLPRPRHAH